MNVVRSFGYVLAALKKIILFLLTITFVIKIILINVIDKSKTRKGS